MSTELPSSVPESAPWTVSAADIGAALYTRDDWNPTTAADKDPINLLFAHSLAPLGEALRFVEAVLGCRATRPSFGTQWFCEPGPDGPCHRHDTERATHTVAVVNRYHLRLYQLSPLAGFFVRPLTAAPIHREVLKLLCGWTPRRPWRSPVMDLPDSFDAARDWARSLAEADSDYRVDTFWLGNVEPIIQCDGTPLQADGYACVVARASDPPSRQADSGTDEWGGEWLAW